ncbi:MAG TPA: alkaline phosphatase family protein, partial [Nevskiaceae bacterium]|nr:alkaline phosphatase family protein [Nevskiaceae bacterium]
DEIASDGAGGVTVTGDPQPLGDACTSRDAVQMAGQNIGDLLNAHHVSWGFFQGGFDLSVTNADGSTGCSRTTTSAVTSQKKVDYIPHHEPFQYYASTANPSHARPSSASNIGRGDAANHQYDIHDFYDALDAGNFPAVSFLKAPGYQDGHAGYSDPLDEQDFIVSLVNRVQQTPEWGSTAVVIAYDDSDGWYDHQMSPIVNPSAIPAASAGATMNGVAVAGTADALNGDGVCNHSSMQQGNATPATPLGGAQGRCGYGPRLPLLVISPYARSNYIDHTLTDQTSILRFIEDNWLHGQRIAGSYDALAGTLDNLFDFSAPSSGPLYLDPATGLPRSCPTCT